MSRRHWAWSLLLALLLSFLVAGAAAARPELAPSPPDLEWGWPLVSTALAFLVPVGFLLLAAGGLPSEEARQASLAGVGTIGLAVLGYWACGFALQFGGVGIVSGSPGLQGLIWEWSALDVQWGTGWGMVGLHGFALTEGGSTPEALALFFSQLPWVATATLVPLLTLRGRTPTLVAALAGLLVGTIFYPLAGNWIWGGGWLAHLGSNLGLGHGFVDFAGSGLVHLVGASMAAAGILSFLPRRTRRSADGPVPLPPVHLPLLAALGSVLLLAGSVGWFMASPLLDWKTLDPARTVVNLILAAAGGSFLPLAYTWFVSNRPDPLMAARGLAAGIVAISAGAPFMSPVAALAVGAVAGLFTPLACYLIDHVLRWNDPTAALTVHGLGAVWGLLALGLFGDGTSGAGWNRIGVDEYLHVAGQGVSGLWTAAGLQPDWPGQLGAQALGLAAIGLFTFAVGGLIFGGLAGIAYLVRSRETVTSQHDEAESVALEDAGPQETMQGASAESPPTPVPDDLDMAIEAADGDAPKATHEPASES